MDLFPDEDQQQIVDTVADFCARRFPMQRVRAQAGLPKSVDDDDWRALAELGCFGVGLSGESGGFGVVGELLVVRELNRHLVPGPVIPTILAVQLLSGSRPDVAAEVANGSLRVALAQPYHADGEPVLLINDLGDGLVLVADDAECALYPAEACTDVASVRSLDPSTRLATATLADVAPLANAEDHSALRLRAHVLVAAAMCGLAAATTASSVEYAKQRRQFGQPIGAFQAVKHRCAEMAVRTEAAFSQTVYAGLVLDGIGPDAEFQAAAARLVASTAAGDNAGDNIQNHGGIGFTEECDAHLYLRRWRALDRLFGDRFTIADRFTTLTAAQ